MSNKIIFDNGTNFIVTNNEFKYRKVWITLNLMTVVLSLHVVLPNLITTVR